MSADTSDKVTLSLRLIRSFAHRNIKHCVCHNVDLHQNAGEFFKQFLDGLPSRKELPLPFKKFAYDTMKIEHKAHGAKTSDPVINTENDDLLMVKLDKSLEDNSIEHETEISIFKLTDYREYQKKPGEITW